MLGLGPALIQSVIYGTYAILGAAALSVGHAWAESTPGWKRVRYVLAWVGCTVGLTFPVFIALGYPGKFASAHSNVGWTALPLSALTTAAALGFTRRQWSWAARSPGFFRRVTRLFPIHLAVLAVFGAVDLVILSLIFLGNIH